MVLTGDQLRLLREVERGRNPPATLPTMQEVLALGLVEVDRNNWAALTELGRRAVAGADLRTPRERRAADVAGAVLPFTALPLLVAAGAWVGLPAGVVVAATVVLAVVLLARALRRPG